MSSEFNNWTIKIDDDFVDRKTVEKAYRFWKAYHLKGDETYCPMCGCDLHHTVNAKIDEIRGK